MKKRLFVILAVSTLLLTACNSMSNGLPLPYDSDDLSDILDDFSDTPWTDYSVPATSVTFAQGEDNLTLNKGDTHQYQFSIEPKEATASALEWRSTNGNVASIDNGLLTAVGGGEANIIVSSKNNYFNDITLKVKVEVPLTSFEITPNGTIEADFNQTINFEATFAPSDATDKELTWSIPETQQNIATVDNGVVTTYNVEGTAILTVSSAKLPNANKTINIHVLDRTEHVTGISFGESPNRVEVGKQITVNATVSPSNADALADGIKYYSRNTDIATIDENSGVITALKAGHVSIYAVCEITSSDFDVEVFEINADALSLSEAGPIALGNNGTHQLEWAFTNSSEIVTPSIDDVLFETSNINIANVSATGLITAIGKGSATITIKHTDSVNGLLSDTIVVNVTITAEQVTLNGATSIYNDAETVLTATVTPLGLSDGTITYTASPADLVDLTPNGNTVTVAAKGVNGQVTITATCNGVNGTHVIEITDRPVLFITGDMYIVGSANYSNGTSQDVEGGSWLNAKYAYHFTTVCADPDLAIQYKATLILRAGDEWRYVRGGTGNAEVWVKAFENNVHNIEQGGAFADGSMSYVDSSNPESNIVVNTAGSYDFYAKKFNDGHYGLFVTKTPSLNVENNNVTINVGDTEQIVAHDYTGTLSYVSNNTDIATVSNTGLISGVAKGNTTITVSDEKNSVTVNVSVTDVVLKTIYLNANGLFDQADAVPFIHSFSSSEGNNDFFDAKMTLVQGQTQVYSAHIPEVLDKVIFVRMPNGSTTLNWDNKWNESESYSHGTNNMWTMTGYNDSSKMIGTWSIFDPNETYGGGSTPDPSQTMKTITIVSSADYSAGGAWFALWAWKDSGEGHFYHGSANGYNTTIEVPDDCNGYIVFRMKDSANAASITGFPDNLFWNKTDDMTNISGTTFTINGWGSGEGGLSGSWA